MMYYLGMYVTVRVKTALLPLPKMATAEIRKRLTGREAVRTPWAEKGTPDLMI